MKYEEKIEKLEQIVADIESGKLSVDLLAEKVKEASSLVKECRKMLIKVQTEVNRVLQDAEKEE